MFLPEHSMSWRQSFLFLKFRINHTDLSSQKFKPQIFIRIFLSSFSTKQDFYFLLWMNHRLIANINSSENEDKSNRILSWKKKKTLNSKFLLKSLERFPRNTGHINTFVSKIIFTYPKMMIFNEISNQCDPYLQGMCENQA